MMVLCLLRLPPFLVCLFLFVCMLCIVCVLIACITFYVYSRHTETIVFVVLSAPFIAIICLIGVMHSPLCYWTVAGIVSILLRWVNKHMLLYLCSNEGCTYDKSKVHVGMVMLCCDSPMGFLCTCWWCSCTVGHVPHIFSHIVTHALS